MNESAPSSQPRKVPSWALQALGYAVSIGCLAWVLHDYPVGRLVTEIRSLDWNWVLLAVVADLAVYVCHGWRWSILLTPVRNPGLWRSVQAVYIGLFANEVLPLRTGEVIRCYLLAHWKHMHLSVVFASAALERLIDGVWMLAAFLLTASLVKGIPPTLVHVTQGMAVVLGAGCAILLYIVLHKQHAHTVVKEHKWSVPLRHIIDGLHLMGNARTLSQTAVVSLVYLLLQIVSVYGLMRAFGLDLSIWAAGGLLTVVRMGTVIPNAPGNLGLFQAACVIGLGLFEVERNDAQGFSFIMFFALTLPLLIGGAVAVALTGLNLGEIRARARHSAATAHHGPLPGAH